MYGYGAGETGKNRFCGEGQLRRCGSTEGSQPFVPGCRGGSALLGSRGNAEHNPAVVDGVGCFSLVGNRKALPHLINALFRRYGFGCAHHSLLGGWR